MDTLSHGLWGAVVAGRGARNRWPGLFIGAAPDLLSFGFFTAGTLLGKYHGLDFSQGPPDPAIVPLYIHRLYDVTHSLLVFGAVFGLVWALRRRPWWPLLGWGLHIVMDIFTHAYAFFPTPFLWPFKHARVDGIPWSTPWIFWSNWAALLFCLGLLGLRRWSDARRVAGAPRELSL